MYVGGNVICRLNLVIVVLNDDQYFCCNKKQCCITQYRWPTCRWAFNNFEFIYRLFSPSKNSFKRNLSFLLVFIRNCTLPFVLIIYCIYYFSAILIWGFFNRDLIVESKYLMIFAKWTMFTNPLAFLNNGTWLNLID